MRKLKKKVTEKVLVHPSDKRAPKSKHAPAQAKIKSAEAYNPDSDFSERTISAQDFYRRAAVPVQAMAEGKASVRGRIAVIKYYKNGRMAEATKTGTGWSLGFSKTQESDRHLPKNGVKVIIETKMINTNDDFKRLVESKEWVTSKLLESAGFDAFDYGDFGFGGSSVVGAPNNEFIPLLGGPFSKQLYMYDYLDMQAKCFWAKNHHPFGKSIVNTKRSYIIGKGLKLLFKNPICQKSWDDFEKRCDFPDKLRSDVETLIWGGELMTEKLTNSAGRPTIGQIDPSTVWEIVTDPITPDVALYFHQQYPTQWQLTYKKDDISSEYVINDIPGDKVIHVKINATPGEKRGRSDLFAVLSWLKRWRDYMNAKVVKAQMEESWALDIAVDGDQGDVDAIAGDPNVTRVPPAGSVRVHNKAIEYQFLNPTASSTQGRDTTADTLKTAIAVGAGIAPEWLGESAAGSTKVTARTKEGPASRDVEDKQMVTERYVRKVAEFVIEQDQKAGFVPETQPVQASLSTIKQALLQWDWKAMVKIGMVLLKGGIEEEPIDTSFEVIFPEYDNDDRAVKLQAIRDAESAGYFSHTRAAAMYAKEMGVTNYSPEEEQEEIQAERDMGIGAPEWQLQQQQGGGQGGAAGADKNADGSSKDKKGDNQRQPAEKK